MYEQNVLTFLFYTKPELLDMVIFDISSYGLNCWCASRHLMSIHTLTRPHCKAYIVRPAVFNSRFHLLSWWVVLRWCVGSHMLDAFAIRWKDVDKPWVDKPAFIVHFAGCSMCSGFHPERLGDCDVEYIRIFAESFGHVIKTAQKLQLAPSEPHSEWSSR